MVFAMPDNKAGDSLSRGTAAKLRHHIFSVEDGAYLGSEQDLLDMLKVSRPTFRQAARLLEHEQLLVIRRGVKGGFFARRPSIETVASAAATYLHFDQATMRDILHASLPLVEATVRQAARSEDASHREALQRLATCDLRWLNEVVTQLGTVSSEFFKLDTEMIEVLSQMAGNSAIRLFLNILYQFGGQANLGFFDHHPDRVSHWREIRMRMLKAVISGDVELAALYAQRRASVLMEWMEASDDSQYLSGVLHRTV